jgi:hypothetical protein
MTLTAQDWQNRVLWETGQALPGGPAADANTTQAMGALAAKVDTLWQMAQVQVPAGNVYLTFLYTKLAAVDVLLGELRSRVDATLGRVFRISDSQRFKQLLELRKATAEAVKAWEVQSRANRRPLTAPILATAPYQAGGYRHVPAEGEPVNPGGGGPGDPNSRRYGGWPVGPCDGTAVPQPGD